MKIFKILILGMLGVLLSLPTSASSDNLNQIKQRGTLRVGMSTFVPWAMRDKQGELIGFEIDVAKRLAADSGLKIEFVPTAWDGIIPALLASKFDVIIGGMSITEERAKSVLFTTPYSHHTLSPDGPATCPSTGSRQQPIHINLFTPYTLT